MGFSKFFLPMLIFSTGCISAITSQNTTLNTHEGPPLEIREIKMEQTSDITVETIEAILKKDSKTFGIDNLKEKGNPSDFELRIWSDDDVTLLHCLSISRSDGKWNASMFTGDMVLNRRTGYLDLKKTRSLKNLSPKSGWKEVDDVFFSKGIRFPFSYKIDEVNTPAPDGEIIKLELRSKEQYSLVFYQKFSDSDDAKKIIELCRWLQDEFNIDLGC